MAHVEVTMVHHPLRHLEPFDKSSDHNDLLRSIVEYPSIENWERRVILINKKKMLNFDILQYIFSLPWLTRKTSHDMTWHIYIPSAYYKWKRQDSYTSSFGFKVTYFR